MNSPRPNFFMIGAPKCGTTSFAAWLSQHPNIFMPVVKEPNYFNFDINTGYIQSLIEYESLYKKVNHDHKAIGEASTGYIYSDEAVKNILGYNPTSKFIALLRNPVEMAPSLHGQQAYEGNENVRDFAIAWNLQTARQNGQQIGKFCREPKLLQYSTICSLGRQVSLLYDQVPEDRVLIILLEDVKNDPKKEYIRALEFLEVPYKGFEDFKVLNTAKTRRSYVFRDVLLTMTRLRKKLGIPGGIGVLKKLHEYNTKPQTRTLLDPAMKKELKDHFKEDIFLLESLIKRDLSEWRK